MKPAAPSESLTVGQPTKLPLWNGINEYWDELYAVQDLFKSSDRNVTREQSDRFVSLLISRHSAILNIAWAPRVKRGERAAHEQLAVREGLPDYHIRSLGPNGSLPASPERDEYFPKFYSTEAMGSPVYGIDIDGPQNAAGLRDFLAADGKVKAVA